jgi:hypothetical protein
MANFTKFKSMNMALNRAMLVVPIAFILVAGCIPHPPEPQVKRESKTKTLAKDWREQVRKSPDNPYEGYSYPADNDSDYYYPTKRVNNSNNRKQYNSQQFNDYYGDNNYPADNDNQYYGRFPKYNPEDDNTYSDPKNYPLYLD